MRERYAALVDAGLAVCARCGMPIAPGAPFDLGHTPDRTGWTGPEHPKCNRVAGAKAGAAVTNSRRLPAEPENRLKSSRVWFEPIPDYVYVAPRSSRSTGGRSFGKSEGARFH